MMRFLVAVSFTDDNFGKLMGGLDNELGLGNEVRKRTKRQPFFGFAVLYYRTDRTFAKTGCPGTNAEKTQK